MAGRTRPKRKPHTQIGQNGRGTGKPKPKNVPPFQTGGLPFQAGQMPKPPPTIPNFLPSTPSFERGMSSINDMRSLAESQYGIRTGMIQPQLDLGLARLTTDQGIATDRLNENMAERGVFTSGFRPTLYQQHIATPFGRQRQDLASAAAQSYADAGMQYGQDLLGADQNLFNLYNDTAQETAGQPYLGFDLGGYQVPNQAGPYFTTPRPGAGRTRPNRRGNNRGGNNRGGNNRGRR